MQNLFLPFILSLVLTGCAQLSGDSASPWAIGWPTPNGPVGIAKGTNNMTECVQVAEKYQSCLSQFTEALCDKNYKKARSECKGGNIVPGTMPNLSVSQFQDAGIEEPLDEPSDEETEDPAQSSRSDTKPQRGRRSTEDRGRENKGIEQGSRRHRNSNQLTRAVRKPTAQELNAYAIITCAGSLFSISQRIICSNRQLLGNDFYIVNFFDSLRGSAHDDKSKNYVTKVFNDYNEGNIDCGNRNCILDNMIGVSEQFRFELPYMSFSMK